MLSSRPTPPLLLTTALSPTGQPVVVSEVVAMQLHLLQAAVDSQRLRHSQRAGRPDSVVAKVQRGERACADRPQA